MNNDKQIVPSEIQLPAERTQSQKGLGEIDKEDRIIPRIHIIQTNSPEIDAGTHKPGDLASKFQNYGKSLIFIPLTWWKSRIYWAPREDGGGILCQAINAMDGSVYGKCEKCQFSEWTEEPPACTAIINLVTLIDKIPVALSLMKTSYTTGKQLINLFDYKKVDIFNFQYELYTERVEKDKNIYYVQKHRDQNTPVSDEMYKLCNGVYESFKQLGGKEKVQDIDADATS